MSQTQLIMDHLTTKGAITPKLALREYGCMRLAARIQELRDRGIPIETRLVSRHGARFAQYEIGKKP